jgi:hypothetical protein
MHSTACPRKQPTWPSRAPLPPGALRPSFREVETIEGNGRVERVTIFNDKTKEVETLELDAIIPLLGFHSDLGAVKQWGLDTEKADVKVNQLMETNVPASTPQATSPPIPASSS